MKKAWKPPSSLPISIYFEFSSKPSLITVVCMDPHSPKKLFATKYWFLILWDDTSFFFFISRFFWFVFVFLCYFTLLLMFIKITLLIFFFHENYFNFFMFRDVPGCSGMFVRNVPCSGFYRRPTQRYFQLVVASLLPSEYIKDISWQRGDIRILSSSERYFQHEILSQNACHKNVMKLGYKVIKEK